ncbi:MAG: hypothetical protein M1818_004235 [Claussenomyces sp. TS43310]|nr:MAG: hypothetical protein M1818_004235 [Claussenomyces sp. TS43310]
MSDWEGDWGFDKEILSMIENATLPHDRRRAEDCDRVATVCTREELDFYDTIKINAEAFAQKEANMRCQISIDALRSFLREEAIKKNLRSNSSVDNQSDLTSWFIDLIMCDEEKLWLKDHAYKYSQCIAGSFVPSRCTLEGTLWDYVIARENLGMSSTDTELQRECCRILIDHDRFFSKVKSLTATQLIHELVMSKTAWLTGFKRRVGLPWMQIIGDCFHADELPHGGNIHNDHRLQNELADFTRSQMSMGFVPSDLALQSPARKVIFGNDDSWNQTAADDTTWLARFKQPYEFMVGVGPKHHRYPEVPANRESDTQIPTIFLSPATLQGHDKTNDANAFGLVGSNGLVNSPLFANMLSNLSRFVDDCKSDMLYAHVPSDEEIRNQLRTFIYEFDSHLLHSPDVEQLIGSEGWLSEFKRSRGQAFPEMRSPHQDLSLSMESFDADEVIDRHLIKNEPPLPGRIVEPRLGSGKECPPDLEMRVAAYVKQSLEGGFCPSSNDLREMTRIVSGNVVTFLDDPETLERFKDRCGISSSTGTRAKLVQPYAGAMGRTNLAHISTQMPSMADGDNFQITNDDQDPSIVHWQAQRTDFGI